ncbi:unnamed protein product [Leptidea sinapis]|uniref:High-affinity choline transporter 1 n=1 Tax=Leptidea sinapis TaxID=189913 RepID=A0A5E4Q0A0_9NEOP|nr:unnamed protein product [Leptidea sinapis]
MINIAGVISIILFYVLILAVGIWAGRKKPAGNDSEEEVMLAGRSIGLFVGIFTMTGGIFFANPMRKQGYVTMLDPLQDSFGSRMGGATLAVIIDMDQKTSVIFSACVAVFYTLFGGLYSVAYTDVIQLFCIFIGLWMCIPFAWANPHVKPLSSMEVDWIGKIDPEYYWFYIDYGLLLIFGGIPWQRASEMEIIWVMRVSILVVGVLSTIMALTIPSIYGLWSMCSDLVYVILFPQLLMVVHFKNYCNTYGSLAAYMVALLVRLTGGEKLLGLPALVHYPGWDAENEVQLFPFRTLAMTLSLFTLAFISWLSVPESDYFNCVVNIPEDIRRVDEPSEAGEQMSVLSGAPGRLYGAAGLVGPDERGGRDNPALEPDDDLDDPNDGPAPLTGHQTAF